MTHAPQGPDHDDLPPRDEIDEVLSRANPNPARVGCPPRQTLTALARRAQPIDDPAYEHLVQCSPCYREFRQLQQEVTQASAGVAAAKSRARVLGAAAVILIVLGGAWWLTRGDTGKRPGQIVPVAANTPVQARLDLRQFAVVRSDQSPPATGAVELPATVVDVTLLLPVGSEPGDYDVQVLDGEQRSKGDATGTAVIIDFITTLSVRLNLVGVATGPYQLAVRHQGEAWRMYPATVREK